MSSSTALARHIIIRASAGSGKTFQLSNRYLQLVAAGESPVRLLATTFTRRAAAEVLERVLKRLAAAAKSPEVCRRLGRELGMDLSRDQLIQILERLLRSVHNLRICTLDSFFAQVLRGHVFDFGLPPAWRIVDEATDEGLRAAAVHDVLAVGRRRDLARLVRWLAKGEVRRTVHGQILDVVHQFHGLFVQTTPQMWRSIEPQKELQDGEVAAIVQEWRDARLPKHKTFRKGWQVALEHVTEGRWEKLLRTTLATQVQQGDFLYCRQEIPPECQESWRHILKHARAKVLNEVAERTRVTHDLLTSFDAAYNVRKSALGVLRFEDVTRLLANSDAVQVLEDVYYRIDGQIGHLLLDEFQDTSAEQWRVLEPIAQEIAAHTDESHSFFCVGDVKQSIYGWRGADPAIFKGIEKVLPGVASQPLNISYRSAPVILDVVNRIFRSLPANAAINEKHLDAVRAWHADFEEHETARQDLNGHVSMAVAPEAPDSDSQERVTINFVAQEIATVRRQAPTRTVGVLVRENELVGRLITELKRLDIPASEEGGVRLTDEPAVNVILSLLHLARHPSDSRAAYHVKHSPLGPVVGFAPAVTPTRPDTNEVRRVASRLRRELAERGLARTVTRVVVALRERVPARSRSRLRQLLDLAYRYEAESSGRDEGFVAFVQGTKLEDPSSSAVRVMTVHQAKGLQFDVVFLPQLGKRLSGQTPPALTARDAETHELCGVSAYFSEALATFHPALRAFHADRYEREIRDSLSILYVALTRAIHAIRMILPPAKPNEKTTPETFAGILRGALAPTRECRAGELLYEDGDPNWLAKKQVAEPAKATPPRPSLNLAPNRRRILHRATPSSLQGGDAVRLTDCFRLESDQGLRRGSLFHAWFEQIGWLEGGPPARDELLDAGRRLGFASEELRELLASFEEILQTASIGRLFERAAYLDKTQSATEWQVECHRERRFAVRDGDYLLSGSFDRVVTVAHRARIESAVVVDFKTDAAKDEEAISRLTARYRPQLSAYGRAASQVFGIAPDQVTTQLAFVRAGRVVDL